MTHIIQESLFGNHATHVRIWNEEVPDRTENLDFTVDYFVALCDDDAEPVGTVYHFTLGDKEQRAWDLAEKIAGEKGMEIVAEM